MLGFGGVQTPYWHVQFDAGGVPTHEPDTVLPSVLLFEFGVWVGVVEFGSVHAPLMHVNPAPGCTPRQLPAPAPPVGAPLVLEPLVLAAFGSNCHVPL